MSISTPYTVTLGGKVRVGIAVPDGTIYIGTVQAQPPAIDIDALNKKLLPANNQNLGSTKAMGAVIKSRPENHTILTVVNTYLIAPLTADEMTFILQNRDKYVFKMGVGDNRSHVSSRFGLVNNWSGEDVVDFALQPEFFTQPGALYYHKLSFSGASGTLNIMDGHRLPEHYGSIRYLTVRTR